MDLERSEQEAELAQLRLKYGSDKGIGTFKLVYFNLMFKRRTWERKTVKRKKLKVDKERPSPINLFQQVKEELGQVKVDSARNYNHTKKLIKAFAITIDKGTLTKEGVFT